MQTYIFRRLLAAVVTVLILSVAVFWLLRVMPTSPAVLILGMNASQEQVDALEHEMGLDRPIWVQYADWMRQVVTGDLCKSFVSGSSIAEEITSRFPVTLELLVLTVAFTVLFGIPFGIISAVFQNSLLDYGVRVFAIFGLSIPTFWLATLVLLVPAEQWGYAPPLGRTIGLLDDPIGNLQQFVPPALILGLTAAAGIMRLTRSSLLEVLRQDYIRTARAKGLRERIVVFRHALKNSLVPVVTVLGLQIAGLLGGAVIVESIFRLRGLGLFTFEALLRRDFLVVQTMAVYIAVVVVLMNLVVDIFYAWLDPRIRYS